MGAREWDPPFLSNDLETSCPERLIHSERSEVVHYVTGKIMFLQGQDTKQCSLS
jgi:hypothetical protein